MSIARFSFNDTRVGFYHVRKSRFHSRLRATPGGGVDLFQAHDLENDELSTFITGSQAHAGRALGLETPAYPVGSDVASSMLPDADHAAGLLQGESLAQRQQQQHQRAPRRSGPASKPSAGPKHKAKIPCRFFGSKSGELHTQLLSCLLASAPVFRKNGLDKIEGLTIRCASPHFGYTAEVWHHRLKALRQVPKDNFGVQSSFHLQEEC